LSTLSAAEVADSSQNQPAPVVHWASHRRPLAYYHHRRRNQRPPPARVFNLSLVEKAPRRVNRSVAATVSIKPRAVAPSHRARTPAKDFSRGPWQLRCWRENSNVHVRPAPESALREYTATQGLRRDGAAVRRQRQPVDPSGIATTCRLPRSQCAARVNLRPTPHPRQALIFH